MIYRSVFPQVDAAISITYKYIIPDNLYDKLYDLFHHLKRRVLTSYLRGLVKKILVNKIG